MNSPDLQAYGFSHWWPFSPAEEKDLLARVSAKPGAYAIRRRQQYPRRKGVSDLAYIGSAANRHGLQMRLRQYFHPGPTQTTNTRILALIGKSRDFEVSFLEVASPARAKALEAELLERYELDHGELPPENVRR